MEDFIIVNSKERVKSNSLKSLTNITIPWSIRDIYNSWSHGNPHYPRYQYQPSLNGKKIAIAIVWYLICTMINMAVIINVRRDNKFSRHAKMKGTWNNSMTDKLHYLHFCICIWCRSWSTKEEICFIRKTTVWYLEFRMQYIDFQSSTKGSGITENRDDKIILSNKTIFNTLQFLLLKQGQ